MTSQLPFRSAKNETNEPKTNETSEDEEGDEVDDGVRPEAVLDSISSLSLGLQDCQRRSTFRHRD